MSHVKSSGKKNENNSFDETLFNILHRILSLVVITRELTPSTRTYTMKQKRKKKNKETTYTKLLTYQ